LATCGSARNIRSCGTTSLETAGSRSKRQTKCGGANAKCLGAPLPFAWPSCRVCPKKTQSASRRERYSCTGGSLDPEAPGCPRSLLQAVQLQRRTFSRGPMHSDTHATTSSDSGPFATPLSAPGVGTKKAAQKPAFAGHRCWCGGTGVTESEHGNMARFRSSNMHRKAVAPWTPALSLLTGRQGSSPIRFGSSPQAGLA